LTGRMVAVETLTAQQKQYFDDQGYLLLRNVIPHELCDRVNAYMWAARDGTRAVNYTSAADGDNSINQSHEYEPLMMDLARHPPVPQVLRSLLGFDAAICQSLYMFRALKNPAHQDEFFLPPKPGPLVAAWMALQDVRVEDGAMLVIPRSHLGPAILAQNIEGHWWEDDQVKEAYYDRITQICGDAQPTPIEMTKGDILFFHGRLIHTAVGKAESGRARLTYACHYHRADAVLDTSNNCLDLTSMRL